MAASRIDLSQPVEFPIPEKVDKKKSTTSKATPAQKRPRADSSREVSGTPDVLLGDGIGKANRGTSRPAKGTVTPAGGKENREDGSTPSGLPSLLPSENITQVGTPLADAEDIEMMDASAIAAAEAAAAASAIKEETEQVSREEEIEKLRTGGSMTQNLAEVHRVRNLALIQMGKYEMEPWYFSPYPASFSDADKVYIDEFCLSYFDDEKAYHRHRAKCTLQHPPGNEIYRDENVSFFEVDGRRQRTWCRNLCLITKLFLDHKFLYYDVDPFLFYCMTTRDKHGCHLIGFFSKEKESPDGYNVACILTLPQYQRKGYGRLLIEFSYELSKREGKLGSPEKPLSDLGLLGYRQYWRETLTDLLVERESTSEQELCQLSSMTEKDVHETLQIMGVLRYHRGNWLISLKSEIIEGREKRLKKEAERGTRKIDPAKLQWKPPVFTASSRTWNW